MFNNAYRHRRSLGLIVVLPALLFWLLFGFSVPIQAGSVDSHTSTNTITVNTETRESITYTDEASKEVDESRTHTDQLDLEEGSLDEQVFDSTDPRTIETKENYPTNTQPSDPNPETTELTNVSSQDEMKNEPSDETDLSDEVELPDETDLSDETEDSIDETSNEVEDHSNQRSISQDTTVRQAQEITSTEIDVSNNRQTDVEFDNETVETNVEDFQEISAEESNVEVEDEDLQISLQSLENPIKAKAAPQYEIRAIDGNLYIVNIHTNEIRKDNAWVEINGKHYFPNAEGKLYQNRWITFGPKFAHYMGGDGVAYTGVRQVNKNLHLFDDINYDFTVLTRKLIDVIERA